VARTVPVFIPYSALAARGARTCPAAPPRRMLCAMINPLPFLTYTFVMSITPGPNNVMLTASGAAFGFRRTVPHILGIATGFTVQLLAVCAGLSAVFTRWPALQEMLGWAGAAYLVYLGWRMLGRRDAAAQLQAQPMTFVQAALFQFLNPKAWVMTLTAATLFLPRELGPLASGAYMALAMEGVGIPCMSVWALFGSSLRGVLGAPRGRRVFNVTMALALGTTAVMMVR
jgi:threonine/homoserine/homoserine lactone efflux protein